MICVEGWVLTEFVLFLSMWIYFEVHRSNCIGIYHRMMCCGVGFNRILCFFCQHGYILKVAFVDFFFFWKAEVHRSNCVGIYCQTICIEGWGLMRSCAFSVARGRSATQYIWVGDMIYVEGWQYWGVCCHLLQPICHRLLSYFMSYPIVSPICSVKIEKQLTKWQSQYGES